MLHELDSAEFPLADCCEYRCTYKWCLILELCAHVHEPVPVFPHINCTKSSVCVQMCPTQAQVDQVKVDLMRYQGTLTRLAGALPLLCLEHTENTTCNRCNDPVTHSNSFRIIVAPASTHVNNCMLAAILYTAFLNLFMNV